MRRADVRLGLELAAAAWDRDRPVMCNLIVTRRCNLSCTYCVEYDDVSPPVPFDTLCARLDHLARLRTVMVTMTGGESLLYPQIVALVGEIRARGMTPSLNTNGTLLTRELIDDLGHAGLYAMQISVDNARPTPVSRKSLSVLLPKLRLLADHARFRVRVNSVLGAGPPEETLEVTRAIVALGLEGKVALLRNPDGTPAPLDPRARAIHDEIARVRRAGLGRSEDFQDDLLARGESHWKCRAGARFFHVCEDGRVHLCAPRTGSPGIPLEAYTVAHIRRAFVEQKSCAKTCPVAYAHMISNLDRLRPQPERERQVRLPVIAA